MAVFVSLYPQFCMYAYAKKAEICYVSGVLGYGDVFFIPLGSGAFGVQISLDTKLLQNCS